MTVAKTGAVSASAFNTEVVRASSTAQISMSQMRTRLGAGAGAISFSDMRGTVGFTVTQSYQDTGKTGAFSGYSSSWGVPAGMGSISPANANTDSQIAANCYIYQITTTQPGGTTSGIGLNPISGGFSSDVNGNTITIGYKGTDVNLVCIANASKTISASANVSVSINHAMANTGSVGLLIRFG